MATGPPTGGPPPTQLLEQTPPPSPTSWDGDRMFNIYIYDYCIKRGYANTARELTREADIPQDSSPPINAKQGLLFEWWSVFWVLFTAKSSGNGPEDALLYTQHQAQQTQRQPPRQGAQPGPPRYIGPVNGARPGMPPTQMPNGVVSATAQPSQPPMTNGAQSGSFGPGPQPNGIVGPSHPAGPSIGTPAMMPGQRPGVAPPQRAPNGAPFQSPTMAHSPHHPGHPGQQPPMNASLGPQGSMQMRGAMPPPGPPQGLMGNPQQPPPGFQPLAGASNSHPNSPAAHGVSQSPSFANRQPQLQGQIRSQNPDATVNTEFMRIEAVRLNQLKDELGLGGVDVPSLSAQDKARIVALAKERGAIRDQIPKPGAPQNGPDGQPNRMQQPLQPGQQRPLGAPFAQQGQNQQRIKRNSTSPGDEGQNESSPPANKRPRTSPTGVEPQPPMAGLGFPPQPPMHPGPGGPQHPPNAMTPLLPGGGSFASGQRMGNPSMGGMPAPILQYRQNMTALHRSGIPGGAPNMMPTNAPSPANPESPFPPPGDGSQSRPGTSQFPGNRPQQQQQNKPPGMMPPPSPGLKKEDTGSGIQSVHSSPHNLPAVTGGHGAHQPPQQGPGTAPPTPAQNNATITAPSPSAGMNNQQAPGGQGQPGPQGGNQPPVQQSSAPPGNNASNDLFMTQDFMQQLGGIGGFESFDSSSLFPGDQMGGGGELDFDSMINFENPNLWGGFS